MQMPVVEVTDGSVSHISIELRLCLHPYYISAELDGPLPQVSSQKVCCDCFYNW